MKVNAIVVATATLCTQSMLLVILRNSYSKLCMMIIQTTERIVKIEQKMLVTFQSLLRNESLDLVPTEEIAMIVTIVTVVIAIEKDQDHDQVIVAASSPADAADQESIVVEILAKEGLTQETVTEIERIVREEIVGLVAVEKKVMVAALRGSKKAATTNLRE